MLELTYPLVAVAQVSAIYAQKLVRTTCGTCTTCWLQAPHRWAAQVEVRQCSGRHRNTLPSSCLLLAPLLLTPFDASACRPSPQFALLYYFGGWPGLVWAGAVRQVLMWHVTWLVNR